MPYILRKEVENNAKNKEKEISGRYGNGCIAARCPDHAVIGKSCYRDGELFREVIYATAADLTLPVPIVEKDYYVTMILQQLAVKAPDCVFKGGTSLAKCHHAINRFSENIDIAFSNTLTQGQRKRLKDTETDTCKKRVSILL